MCSERRETQTWKRCPCPLVTTVTLAEYSLHARHFKYIDQFNPGKPHRAGVFISISEMDQGLSEIRSVGQGGKGQV